MLPLLVVQSPRIPAAVRAPLCAEVVRCWIDASEGQLRDLRADLAGATRQAVLAAYLGKSGAPFSMVTAMAARLAGRDDERVELWREFGNTFGILWQLFNDQQDILTGRNEDLANGTVTYLLACALESPAPGTAEQGAGAAPRSAALARGPCGATCAPAGTRGAPFVRGGHHRLPRRRARLLDKLGGDAVHRALLHDLVDLASPMLLLPRQGAAAGAAPTGP